MIDSKITPFSKRWFDELAKPSIEKYKFVVEEVGLTGKSMSMSPVRARCSSMNDAIEIAHNLHAKHSKSPCKKDLRARCTVTNKIGIYLQAPKDKNQQIKT